MKAFERKSLEFILWKVKVIVSVPLQRMFFKYQFDPCWVYNLRVKTDSVLCVQCRRWIHSRCAWVKSVKFFLSFAC